MSHMLALSTLPGFDPEGLLGYRVWADDPDDYAGPVILVRDSDSDWRVTDESRVDISLADPRTEDALWRWARERMGWPRWAWWEWQAPDWFVVAVPGAREVKWTAWSTSGHGGDAQLPALAEATSDLHALAIVLRWIGQQPSRAEEVK